MSESSSAAARKVLAFSSVVEGVTSLALIADPAIVVRLLLGAALTGVGAVAGRCFGIGLLALGSACWPGREPAAPAARRGMLIYNALIALYLADLGAVRHMAGLFLWPAVVLHAIVAVLLVRAGRDR